MADTAACSRSQDDRRLPQGQRPCDPKGLLAVVELCRRIGLLSVAAVAIDGSKFKAVNNRDRNFTEAKMKRSMAQIEESVSRYLHQRESADRQECSRARAMKIDRLNDKISTLQGEM